MFYLLLFAVSIFIYFLFDRRGNNIGVRGFGGLGLAILLLCVIAGCRDMGIGTDTRFYSADYYYCATIYQLKDFFADKLPVENLSTGYFILNKLAIWVNEDISSCFFVTELCILGTLIVFKKFQDVYKFNFILLLVLYLFLYYNQTFNYMRQLCGVTFTFAAYYSFVKKRYILCTIDLFIGYLFHTSAIGGVIPIVIYLISNIESLKKRWKLSVLYIIAMVISFLSFNVILQYLSETGIILGIYGERYGINNEFGTGVNTAQVLFLLMGYVLIYISHTKKILSEKQNLRAFLLHTTNFTFLLFGMYSVFLFRISFYVAMPDLLYLVIILSSRKIHIIVKTGYVTLAVLVWLYLYIMLAHCETYPYSSKILGI